MRDLAECAAELAGRGWAVFPCKPGGKTPMCFWTEDWSSDPDYVYDEWPDGANIGLACGPSGLLVADCDVKHGKDGIRDFRGAIGSVPATYSVRTASGGMHYYFATSRTWTNSRGSLPDSIDIRGTGGYVMAAGSLIGGKSYRIVSDADPAPVPGRLREILASRNRKYQRRRPGRQSANWKWRRRPEVLLKRDIESICARVAVAPEGERNNILHWAACRLAEIVDAGRICYEDAEADLTGAARVCGLPDDEAMKTISSGLSAGAR